MNKSQICKNCGFKGPLNIKRGKNQIINIMLTSNLKRVMINNTVKDRSVYPHTNSDGHNYRDKLPHQEPV